MLFVESESPFSGPEVVASCACEDLRWLSAATNLRELALDGNPISDRTQAASC